MSIRVAGLHQCLPPLVDVVAATALPPIAHNFTAVTLSGTASVISDALVRREMAPFYAGRRRTFDLASEPR
jgi:hypothetical protein